MNFTRIDASKLNPAAYNPRVDLLQGDQDYEKLKQSILKFGHVQPIVWNEKTGNIVGGHQSFKVLCDLGKTEIDCVVVVMDEQEEKALNVALNKIGGRWDMDKLTELMEELVDSELAEYTGYDSKEIDRLINAIDIESTINEIGEINVDEYDEEKFEHKCPRCGFLY